MSLARFETPCVAVALILASACVAEVPHESAPDAGCPTCSAGTTCDPERLRCVPALAAASACGEASDGGIVEGRCVEGTACGNVGGAVKRCSVDCTASTAAEACGPNQRCFARGGGAAGGFCGTVAAEGAPCDASALVYCSGSVPLTCITPTASTTTGRCFAACDPASPDCGPGRSCADPFPNEPRRGICIVPPGAYPERCDHATLTFCARGHACVRPGEATWGYCHKRCASDADCSGEQCVRPSADTSFCAKAVARCAPGQDPATCERCSTLEDRYCAAGDVCVQMLAGVTVCKQDCTAPGAACAAGVCTSLGDSGSKACL